MENCLFCRIDDVVFENSTCFAFFDKNPVAKGHLLIIPKAHKKDYFELTEAEIRDTHKLIRKGKEYLDDLYAPDGYNIGFNCGEAAGQSVFHCHCHLIPRYTNDTPDPKGGVRGVIPGKMSY